MAKKVIVGAKLATPKKKRKGVHSKNASKGQNAYKKISRGQGKK
jgi:hypothetical protein